MSTITPPEPEAKYGFQMGMRSRSPIERTAGTAYLPSKTVEGGEYRKQAQIAELNALNAAWDVIRFKQHFGLLERLDDSISYLFETASFDLDKRGTTNAV